ncbi:M14 family zinc carboxypeptidase [Micromonospora yangpuensis]|uniref:Zinc carboxypeptidase n=1 Tax=Micromonospora yangpuensis TaxID=683228 RepID=A0A1C6UND1_9ACTN|nr:M14 family zinc carboxypeptidase [Micromonospora yangpuensis]SCL55524.1 Zinc carboxypeptidase [Micromonospora yangpuensis]
MRPTMSPSRGTAARRLAGAAAVILLAGTAPVLASGPANATTDPSSCVTDPSARLASVPSPESFLGFPLGVGQQRVVTGEEAGNYLAAVAGASKRVRTGVMATSVRGQSLPYAIVSDETNIRPANLRKLTEDIKALRDPRTMTAQRAKEITTSGPAIVWVTANVHGGEKSGTDAALKTLYELAAGLSCDVAERNENLITIVVPTQNPDGHDASRRQNEYGFDMNRDWFARTQQETDGKLELMRKYPPQVFIDAHEMGGRQYFFPPNADPINHEISPQVVDWINRIGDANKTGFGHNGACGGAVTTECYFNYSTYDLFFMGYGDTVPAAGFGAAGMTLEKGSASAVPDRVQQQFNVMWSTLGWAAANRQEVLTSYFQQWKDAIAQGRAGTLEPNEVLQPGNSVQFPVPAEQVRSYFLLPDRQLADVRQLVERLRRMDVEVYQVKKSLRLPTARIFGGRSATNLTVPEGSYWIPMNQPQKHWIQAVMGEDPYVPFPYFYDVSSWSNPLLMGVNAVYTGADVRPNADLIDKIVNTGGGKTTAAPPLKGSYTFELDSAAAAEFTFSLLGQGIEVYRDLETGTASFPAGVLTPELNKSAKLFGVTLTPYTTGAVGTPISLPDVGLFQGTGISLTSGSHGEARYVLGKRWGLDLTPVTAADINDNTTTFTERTVLVVPDGSNATGGLTATGQANLRAWVASGKTYLGLRNQGTRMARAAGLTSTTEKPKPTGYTVIGSHLRVDVADSPVSLGRPAEDFEFNNNDSILNPSTTGTNVLTYPSGGTFWANGYTVNADALKGTVALVDEPTGAGRAVLFAFNPLFRAYNENGLHLVANALLTPNGSAPTARTAPTAPAVDPARAAAAAAPVADDQGGGWRPITIEVAAGDLGRTTAVVQRFTDTATVAQVNGSAYLTIPNPQGLHSDEHPFLGDLVRTLKSDGIPLRSVVG